MANTVSKDVGVWEESGLEDEARPQKRRTDSADPTEDSRSTLVTLKRSQSMPTAIPPKTEVALKIETRSVPMKSGRPTVPVE